MTCDGMTCLRYKAEKPKSMGRYTDGQSRCSECDIWIYWEGVRCPCCNTILRKNPRAMKYKNTLRNTGARQVGLNYIEMKANDELEIPIDLPIEEIP